MKKLFLLPFLLMFGATLGFTNEGATAPEEEAVSGEVETTNAAPENQEEAESKAETSAQTQGEQDAD